MRSEEIKATERKVEKLLKEYERKLDGLKLGRRILLIDFAREYNEIWNETYNAESTSPEEKT